MADNSNRYTLSKQEVKIQVGCNWSRIVSPVAAVEVAKKKFSRFARGVQYTKMYRHGVDNGMRSAIDKNGMFGSGLLPQIMALFHSYGANLQLDFAPRGEKPERQHNFQFTWKGTLREDQKECLKMLAGEYSGIVKLPTGGGKCWGLGTPILMWDGTIKNVEDVQVGDLVMGDDSTPRTVLGTTKGHGPLYQVTPVKGDPYIVNGDHVLSLKYTNGCKLYTTEGEPWKHGKVRTPLDGTKKDISVDEYLKLSKTSKHVLKGYRAPVLRFGGETPSENLPIAPYLMGLWLGDGSIHHYSIVTKDPEIKAYLRGVADAYCLEMHLSYKQGTDAVSIGITHGKSEGNRPNPLRDAFKSLGFAPGMEKYVPHVFKTACFEDRLWLLAGLIDTDGSLTNNVYDYISISRQLAEDVVFLARSVGLYAACTPCEKVCTNAKDGPKVGTYYRVCISGDVDMIPCQIERKKARPRQQVKDVLMTGIKVESVGDGDWYGFMVDGNHRLLMGDFTVTHNSLTAAYHMARLGLNTLYCVPSKELMYQVAEDLPKQVSGMKMGLLGDGHRPDDDCNVVIAMYASLNKLHGKTEAERDAFLDAVAPFECLICDECHTVASRDVITATWSTILDIPAYYRYGFSATPYEITDAKGGTFAELLQHSAFGELIYDLSMQEARDKGYVTPFTAYFIKPDYPRDIIESSKTSTTGKTYQEAQEDVIVNNEYRNQVIVDTVGIMMEDGRKTMVVAQRIPHNDMLAIMLAEKYGEDKVFQIHGQLDTQYRKAALESFKEEKEPCVLMASSVANTGLNINDLECIINASGGLSYIQNTQRTGRGLRLAEGKTNMLLIDFDDRDLGKWFKTHSQKRAEYYKELGADVELLA